MYIHASAANIQNKAHGTMKSLLALDPYLTICHHRKIGLEPVRCSIYSIMWQSILILLVWLLCSIPGSAGLCEAAVSCVTLVFLWGGERVEVFLDVALRLCVEFRLKGGQLLGHPEKPSNFYTQNHPNDICGDVWEKKKHSKSSNLSLLQPTVYKYRFLTSIE